ncbi:flagellar biosynthetic protein FliO [Gracilimonas sp. Q87]|uniref:flagellar biosynthetic protein FliO n=1 Tax=Gracilimonas sp. Q87 TaxID=3384766 RepID=UPI003983E4DE
MDFQKAFSQSGKKPQSILKIVLGISLALLVIWLFLVSKMDTGTVAQSSDPEVQERTLGLQESLKKTSVSKVQESKREEPDMFQNAFITFLFMVSVLVAVWYWSKKKGAVTQKEIKSRDIDSHSLSQNAQLKFIEINEEVWIVGVAETGVNLLHRYSKEEWKEGETENTAHEADECKTTKSKTGKENFKTFLKLANN